MHAAPAAFAALLAAAAAVPATAAVVANSGSVQVTAYSEISGNGYPLFDSMNAAGFPGAASAQIENTVFNYTGYTQSFGRVDAVWQAPDMGQVLFTDFGWLFNGASDDVGQAARLNGGGPNWTYDFFLTTPSKLTVTYDVQGSNRTFGLQGWFLADNATTILDLLDVNDPTASGTFTYSLGPGGHVLTLSNNANLSTEGYLVDWRGDMFGMFDWSITAVPEPGTWALLITGFAMTGAVLRRRKAARA